MLRAATPIWTQTHREAEKVLGEGGPDRLRADLRAIA
jgi:hypothetical protein